VAFRHCRFSIHLNRFNLFKYGNYINRLNL